MSIASIVLNACRRPRLIARSGLCLRRTLLTLAIETSCDDTGVAILEKQTLPDGHIGAILHFHKKITSDNTAYHGVHPLASLYSHQENLASLVDEAILHLPPLNTYPSEHDGRAASGIRKPASFGSRKVPDFIAVTRGPGMRSNLFTGIDTAKGLAAAWQTDLVGVHHMQAHALTPRLVASLQNSQRLKSTSSETSIEPPTPVHSEVEPAFPFLSVLVSGGHTLLVQSASLTEHTVLASTSDIAVGECLDKAARAVLPPEILHSARSTMYGAVLEDFAFSDKPKIGKENRRPGIEANHGESSAYVLEDSTAKEYQEMYALRYTPVSENYEKALKQNTTRWGWRFNQPLTRAAGGLKNKKMEMSFSGLLTAIEHAVQYETDKITGKRSKVERSAEAITMDERRDLAREAMRAAFEHVSGRVVLGLQHSSTQSLGLTPVETVVMSGGVAANSYFRYILASTLVSQGYADIRIVFPPSILCTDNAAMIAWAGIEMYDAGHKDSRAIRGIRKWPLDRLLSPPRDD